MTTAWKGFRATNVAVHTRTRSAIVALIAIMATGACSKQDGAPPTESATAAANQAPSPASADQPAAPPPGTIPEPFHGMWAATTDACQLIQTEGLEPAVTITASEVRDVEYETYCKLHKVVSASATELVAEFVCPSADDPTPAPAPRTLALAAGRLVFQDRSVSYLRCTSKVPAPPVELAEPIEAPLPAGSEIRASEPSQPSRRLGISLAQLKAAFPSFAASIRILSQSSGGTTWWSGDLTRQIGVDKSLYASIWASGRENDLETITLNISFGDPRAFPNEQAVVSRYNTAAIMVMKEVVRFAFPAWSDSDAWCESVAGQFISASAEDFKSGRIGTSSTHVVDYREVTMTRLSTLSEAEYDVADRYGLETPSARGMISMSLGISVQDAKARSSSSSKPAPAAPVDQSTARSDKSDVIKPSIARATQPEYPEAARRAGEQGSVTLDALVLTTGGVSDVRIAKSSGSVVLDQAAMTEVQQNWTFRPGEEQGRPVAMRHAFSVTFKLTDDESASGTGAGSPSVYRRCLTDPAGPKAFTEARLNRMGSLARAIDQHANGQYDTYLRMRESYGYMERNPNGTPDSICSFADLIPVERFEKTLQQLQSN